MYIKTKSTIFDEIENFLWDEINSKSKLKNTCVNKPTWYFTQNEDFSMIEVLLPGYKKEQLKIQPDQEELCISSTFESSENLPRYVKKFELRLPVSHKKFDLHTLDASFSDGVLTLKFNKLKDSTIPTISIK